MEKGLLEALYFAKDFVDILSKQIEIILHCRKSVLIHNGEVCVKIWNKGAFDISQGLFDGAEVSDLMGVFLLSKINKIVHR